MQLFSTTFAKNKFKVLTILLQQKLALIITIKKELFITMHPVIINVYLWAKVAW